MVAILGYSPQQITEAVQDMYTAVANAPDGHFHFPVGREALCFPDYATCDSDLLPDGTRHKIRRHCLGQLLWGAGSGGNTRCCGAAGLRRHRSVVPTALGIIGSALVLYALFVDYGVVTELTGFVFLTGAAARDLYLRRREEAERLGLGNRKQRAP